MEEAEVPLEHLQEHVHESAEHSDEKWISWVALSTAVLAVLAAITGLLSGKHANEAMMSQIQASDQWNYYQAKSIKAAVLDAKMSLAGTTGQNTHPLVPSVGQKSIAVLPFNDFSGKKGNPQVAQGIQDQILTYLAQTPDLKVISREWVTQYKPGVARNSREIGRQLGVAYLLEGSVQSAANTIRLSAELVDAQTSERLWDESYDGDLTELSSIENELVGSVLSQLKRSSPAEKSAIDQDSTDDAMSSDNEKASKYRTEEAEIKSEAERKEVEAKTNFHKHEVLARGVTMFQIAIAIAAISALTKKRRFWTVSLLFGAVGCVFLVLGMFAR